MEAVEEPYRSRPWKWSAASPIPAVEAVEDRVAEKPSRPWRTVSGWCRSLPIPVVQEGRNLHFCPIPDVEDRLRLVPQLRRLSPTIHLRLPAITYIYHN